MKSMRYILVLAFLAAALARPACAQNAALACGSGRYALDLYDEATITVQTATFGYNSTIDYSTTPATSTPVELKLDFYESGDDVGAQRQRPLIIFAFGGSFALGQRQDMDDLCRAFARKGYATATIDYRLVPPGGTPGTASYGANYAIVFGRPELLADEIVRASSDMKAAVRFFRHDAATANTYRIDPRQIIVAGYSAGAITALQTAYIDSDTEDPNYTSAYQANGGLEGNTDLPAPNNLLPAYNARQLAGAFSLAGGVATLAAVSTGNPPLFSVHGDADMVVPYNYGAISGSSYYLYGSGAIQPQATSVGIANQLLTLAGGDHGAPRAAANRPAINVAAATFFQQIVCSAPLPVVLASFTGQRDPGTCAATLSWRTASEVNSQAYEVQASADGQAFAPLGKVPSRNSLAGAAYSFAVGPWEGTRYFRLRLLDADGTFAYGPVLALAASCRAVPTHLAVAPNPAQEQLTVSDLPMGPKVLRLYSATGQLVAESRTEALAATLATSQLPAGVYLLRVQSAAGQAIGSAKVLKQ